MDNEALPLHIRQAGPQEAPLLAGLVGRSFADVAGRFGLTPLNCPKHPSNCTAEWIENDWQRGVAYFVLESGGSPVGCVAMEVAPHGVVYLERLAVLPGQRRRGLGQALVEHVIGLAGASGAGKIGIGIIAAQEELKAWYARIGFRETGTRRFDHLPFDVTFMEYQLAD